VTRQFEGYRDADRERWAAEPVKESSARRSQFQRDRARVLHSSALRRLAAKTQIVRAGSGDFPRTRLTHSLECAQIGRELGAMLGCAPDLVDAACLAHDIGHPPFGHNGETALAALAGPGGELACGGFEGNAQSLRILTRLEPKVPGAGLNLTRATLDAALKYPWVGTSGKYGAYECDLPVFQWIRTRVPDGRRCLEAQVMDWADDVAYSVHDLEDGLQAGLVRMEALRDAAERSLIAQVALDLYCKPEWAASMAELEAAFAGLLALALWDFGFDGGFAALAATKNLTSGLVGRLTWAAYQATAGDSPPRLTRYAADLTVPRRQLLECALLKAIAARYVMGRAGAGEQQARERELITELALVIWRGAPATLDPVLHPAWDGAPSAREQRRVVIDQVASLTDTSAIAWHQRLCPPGPR
jgi:dGTPase